LVLFIACEKAIYFPYTRLETGAGLPTLSTTKNEQCLFLGAGVMVISATFYVFIFEFFKHSATSNPSFGKQKKNKTKSTTFKKKVLVW
jgi:hypothetical protein